METAILKIKCPDKKGIIAAISNFICWNAGNIVTLAEFVERDENLFFMRIEWDLDGFQVPRDQIPAAVEKLASELGISGCWSLYFSDIRPRMSIFVSKFDHCLYDLLLRKRDGELKCEIPLILSNHTDLEPVAGAFGVTFRHVPVTKETKEEAEAKQLALLEEFKIDFIVLARYMQVLSADFISHFENRIINIHHSFLPAFEGARPYHQARERGVKIIGATSHFANNDLDKGPIIQQGVESVTHRDTAEDLVIKGRDIERIVLANALKLYIDHRVFVCRNRTIIL